MSVDHQLNRNCFMIFTYPRLRNKYIIIIDMDVIQYTLLMN